MCSECWCVTVMWDHWQPGIQSSSSHLAQESMLADFSQRASLTGHFHYCHFLWESEQISLPAWEASFPLIYSSGSLSKMCRQLLRCLDSASCLLLAFIEYNLFDRSTSWPGEKGRRTVSAFGICREPIERLLLLTEQGLPVAWSYYQHVNVRRVR